MSDHLAHQLFLIILLLGGVLRFINLGHLPPGVFWDEAYYGIDAANALKTGHFHLYYPVNNGRGALFITAIAGSFSLFGISAASLRLVSALFGTLTLIFVYLFAIELWPRHPARQSMALLAMFLLAVSYWFLNFSRIGFDGITVPLLQTACLWLLLRAQNRKNIYIFALAGAVCGLGMYGYIAFGAIFPVIVLLFVHAGFTKNIALKQVMAFAAAMLIVIFPLIVFIHYHPGMFLHRAMQVMIAPNQGNIIIIFTQNVMKTLQMLFYKGDSNWRHNYASLPELSLLVMLGVVSAAFFSVRKNGEEKGDRLWLLYIWICFAALPAVISNESMPHALRAIGMIAPLHLLAAWGLWQLWDLAGRHFSKRTLVNTVAVVLLMGNLLSTGITYFILWGQNPQTRLYFDSGGVVLPGQPLF